MKRLSEKMLKRIFEETLMLESPNVTTYAKELDLIKDPNKKRILINLLRPAAYKNVSASASSTNKYHPEFAHGEFGLSRHTKAVVGFAYAIADALQLDTDVMVTAAIAHDMYKYTKDTDKYTARNHAKDAADALENAGLKDEARLVRSHMGRWDADRDKSGKTPRPKQLDEICLHIADYLASRKYVSIDFDMMESNFGA
jgi:putative nucleotidyltransferase with HDIG domain